MMFSHKGLFRHFVFVTVVILVLALTGCRTAASTAPAGGAYPVDKQLVQPSATAAKEGYPAPGEKPTSAPPAGGEGGPGGAPVRPNASRIKAEIIEIKPSDEKPDYNLLHVKLLTSGSVEGKANMTDQLVNQEMDLLIKLADMPDLKPGDKFEAEVSYLGDERGAYYYILNLMKVSE